MSTTEEIEKLEQQLVDLKKKKEIEEEISKKNDLNLNFDILLKGINDRIEKVKKNRYSRNCTATKFVDRDIIPVLESIHNLLHIINKKVDGLNKIC